MTRIVAFADLHGNTPALEAFFDALDALAPDLVVNLGDIASGGVDPRGTLDLLAERPGIVTIRGNHERQLLTRTQHAPGGSDELAARVLTNADRAWLGRLPERLEILPGLLAVHGAPDDDRCYLLETVDSAAGESGVREASDAEIVTRLGEWARSADVFLCGHTHLQRTRQLPDGTLVVNPGSLGRPAYDDDEPAPHRMESGTPHARFSVLEQRGGAWSVEHHAIDYDVDRAVALAMRNGRSDVAHALRTGFVARRT